MHLFHKLGYSLLLLLLISRIVAQPSIDGWEDKFPPGGSGPSKTIWECSWDYKVLWAEVKLSGKNWGKCEEIIKAVHDGTNREMTKGNLQR